MNVNKKYISTSKIIKKILLTFIIDKDNSVLLFDKLIKIQLLILIFF